jgi:hypothetical protein
VSEGAERRFGGKGEKPGKIASLLAGDFSLHEVMPDGSLRCVRAPTSGIYAEMRELAYEVAEDDRAR